MKKLRDSENEMRKYNIYLIGNEMSIQYIEIGDQNEEARAGNCLGLMKLQIHRYIKYKQDKLKRNTFPYIPLKLRNTKATKRF